MFLAEIAQSMIVMTSLKHTISIIITSISSQLKFLMDRSQQLCMKSLLTMATDLQRIVQAVFILCNQNHLKKICLKFLPTINLSFGSKLELYQRARKIIFANLLSHSSVGMIQFKFIKTLTKIQEFGVANFQKEKSTIKKDNNDMSWTPISKLVD